ncbi:carboxypeptidase-like regulatory domain-containing protein, partial [Oleiphilus sp. HI0043]
MCKKLLGFMKGRGFTLVLSFFLAFFSLVVHAASLSGVVKDHQGNLIDGASVTLFEVLQDDTFLQIGDTQKVSSDGAYEWDVSPSSYVLRASFIASDVSLSGAPNSVAISSEDFEVYVDTIRDLQFDFLVLSGKVLDTNKAP